MKTLDHFRRLLASLVAVLGCAALVALPLSRPAGVAAQDPVAEYTISVPIVASSLDIIGVHPFGVQMYGPLSDDAISHESLRRSRVSWIRWEVGWRAIQPTEPVPGQEPVYNWRIDEAAAQARDLGLNVIATILSNPEWASMRSADGEHWYSNGPVDPDHYDDFARFIADMARRYPWITHYELYNEPDNANMMGAESPLAGPYWGLYGKEYADMLKVVYPALKEANPEAKLVFGGIAYDGFADPACANTPETCEGFYRPFVDDVLAAGGGDYFDVFNFHYYPTYHPNWDPFGPDIAGKASYLRSKLAEYGHPDKPIICTEVGLSSGPAPDCKQCTQNDQARYIMQTAARSLSVDMDIVIWWTWKDILDPVLGTHGLVTKDLHPKLGVEAFRTVSLQLGQATFVSSMDLGQGIEGYEFRSRSGRPLYVLWSSDGETHAAVLPVGAATVTTMVGEVTGRVADGADGQVDGRITVNVSSDPVYVEARDA
jgi:hypothetical protein